MAKKKINLQEQAMKERQANIAAANVTGGWGKNMTRSHTAVKSTQKQNKYFNRK